MIFHEKKQEHILSYNSAYSIGCGGVGIVNAIISSFGGIDRNMVGNVLSQAKLHSDRKRADHKQRSAVKKAALCKNGEYTVGYAAEAAVVQNRIVISLAHCFGNGCYIRRVFNKQLNLC